MRGLSRAPGFIGLEVVEYNPSLDDKQRRTRDLVGKIIECVFGPAEEGQARQVQA
jgi:arginase family enzyme